jgi:AcrR family transcriptional regulator
MQATATPPKAPRQQLIDAGIEVFGLNGFHGATTRQIAGLAGVNLAAIPYYFGSKEDLYNAVVEALVDRIIDKKLESEQRDCCSLQDIPSDWSDDELVAEILKNITLFANCLEEGNEDKEVAIKLIIAREQILPTAAFPILYERMFKPFYGWFCKTIGRLMRLDSEDPLVIIQVHSLVAQIIFFKIGRASLKCQLNCEMFTSEQAKMILDTVKMNTLAILNNLKKTGSS